jgi:hypothetical protein
MQILIQNLEAKLDFSDARYRALAVQTGASQAELRQIEKRVGGRGSSHRREDSVTHMEDLGYPRQGRSRGIRNTQKESFESKVDLGGQDIDSGRLNLQSETLGDRLELHTIRDDRES